MIGSIHFEEGENYYYSQFINHTSVAAYYSRIYLQSTIKSSYIDKNQEDVKRQDNWRERKSVRLHIPNKNKKSLRVLHNHCRCCRSW